MFKRFKRDRRQGYSLAGHVRRVLTTKGLARVGTSLGATALVAAMVFAHCSSSSITGPGTNTPKQGGSNTPGTANPGTSNNTETWLPATPFNGVILPATILPDPFQNPCTHQTVVWDPAHSYTAMSGYTQSSMSGTLKSQTNMISWALGTAADPLDEHWRKYKGYETYQSQDRVFVTGAERYMEEYDMKVIAYGHQDEEEDADDFFLHHVVKISIDPTKATTKEYAYCTDADYGWWRNDAWYNDRDHD